MKLFRAESITPRWPLNPDSFFDLLLHHREIFSGVFFAHYVCPIETAKWKLIKLPHEEQWGTGYLFCCFSVLKSVFKVPSCGRNKAITFASADIISKITLAQLLSLFPEKKEMKTSFIGASS